MKEAHRYRLVIPLNFYHPKPHKLAVISYFNKRSNTCSLYTLIRSNERCNNMQVFIYCKITLHVSGVYRTHHQECIKLYLQPLVQVISRVGATTFRQRGLKYSLYTGCNRRNGPDFGKLFLMLNYTEKPQNTYTQSWTVSEIMASEVWNFDSCYTLTDYQIRIETGRNMWFL